MALTRFAKSKLSAFSRPTVPALQLGRGRRGFPKIKRPFELRKEQAFTAWID